MSTFTTTSHLPYRHLHIGATSTSKSKSKSSSKSAKLSAKIYKLTSWHDHTAVRYAKTETQVAIFLKKTAGSVHTFVQGTAQHPDWNVQLIPSPRDVVRLFAVQKESDRREKSKAKAKAKVAAKSSLAASSKFNGKRKGKGNGNGRRIDGNAPIQLVKKRRTETGAVAVDNITRSHIVGTAAGTDTAVNSLVHQMVVPQAGSRAALFIRKVMSVSSTLCKEFVTLLKEHSTAQGKRGQ